MSVTTHVALAAVVCLIAFAGRAAAQPHAYVSAVLDDTGCSAISVQCSRGLLNVVNTATNRIEGTIDLWRNANTGLTVWDVLVHPNGQRLYAVLLVPGSSHPGPFPSFMIVRVFDTRTFAELSTFTIDSGASQCTLSPDGRRMLCARSVLASDVIVIDAASTAEATRIPAVFPRSVAMSPDGRRIYVAHGDNTMTVHDGTSYTVIATVALDANAVRLEVAPDGSHLYAGLANGSVADIDPVTGAVRGVIFGVATGSNVPLDIAFAAGNAYVTTGPVAGAGGRVTVIDIAARAIEQAVPIDNPREVAANLDESRVLVTHAFGVSTIDTATNQVVATVALPDGPGRLGLSPPAPLAAVTIDPPRAGTTVQQPFTFGGWAVDVFGFGGGPGIDAVHVWAYPDSGASPIFVGAPQYFRPRPDIAAIFGSTYLNSGYQMTVRGLRAGAYTFIAYGRSTRTGTFSVQQSARLTIQSSMRMAVDVPSAGASVTPGFAIAGWALDAAATSGSGVDAIHVWAYPSLGGTPTFAGSGLLGRPRPDVAAIFGAQFANAGFELTVGNLPAGSYTLVVYARQASTGTFAAQRTVNVTVTAPRPIIVIDVPRPMTTSGTSVRVAGWAIEHGAAIGTGVDAVHVWAYPTSGGSARLVGVASYGHARPDVGGIFGARYAPSGFDVTGSLPPGNYDIVVFAHSTTTNTFNGVSVVRVAVQ